jgi:DNA-binding phage protein
MKKEELTPWVSAELLNSNEAIQNYLKACLEDGDPVLISHAMDVIASAKIRNAEFLKV